MERKKKKTVIIAKDKIKTHERHLKSQEINQKANGNTNRNLIEISLLSGSLNEC